MSSNPARFAALAVAVAAASAGAQTAPATLPASGVLRWPLLNGRSARMSISAGPSAPVVVPIAIDATGRAGSWSTPAAPTSFGMVSFYGTVGDCAAADPTTCPRWLEFGNSAFLTGAETSITMDFIVDSAATATLAGTIVDQGGALASATGSVFGGPPDVGVALHQTFSTGPDGSFTAAVLSGYNTVNATVATTGCVGAQDASAFLFVDPGATTPVTIFAQAPRPGGVPGAFQALVGIAGYPNAGVELDLSDLTTGGPGVDCGGGYSSVWLSNVGPDPLSSGPLTAGTYWLNGPRYVNQDAAVGEFRYAYPSNLALAIEAGKTTTGDYRFSPTTIAGSFPFDAEAGAAPEQGAALFLELDSASGVQASFRTNAWRQGTIPYSFPLDPKQKWSLKSATFESGGPPGARYSVSNEAGLFELRKLNAAALKLPGLLPPLGVASVLYHPLDPAVLTVQCNGTSAEVKNGTTHARSFGGIQPLEPLPQFAFEGSYSFSCRQFDAHYDETGIAPFPLEIAAGEQIEVTEAPPTLSELSPASGATVGRLVPVVGRVAPGSKVTVNGRAAPVVAGIFATLVEVPRGDSRISVTAADAQGRFVTRSRPVHRAQ